MTNPITFIESATDVVEEADSNLFMESTFVQELTGKKWKVRIIKGDVQGSSAFYSKELLEAHADVVKEGTRIYLDHKQTGDRPERRVKDLAGVFASDSYYENGDLYAEVELFSDQVQWVKERFEAGVIGLSISGQGATYEEGGVTYARTIDKIHSVDIVTHAGAGGTFIEMTESQSQEEEIMELPKELLEALDAQAVALTEAVTEMKAFTTKVDTLIEAQTTEEVKEEIEESAAPSVAEVSEALVEAGLTATGRQSVYAAVEAGTELEEAIATEKQRVQEILEESKAPAFGVGNQKQEEAVSLGDSIFG